MSSPSPQSVVRQETELLEIGGTGGGGGGGVALGGLNTVSITVCSKAAGASPVFFTVQTNFAGTESKFIM